MRVRLTQKIFSAWLAKGGFTEYVSLLLVYFELVLPTLLSASARNLQCGKDFHLLTLEVSPGWQDVSGIRSICHDYQAYRREVGAWLKSLSNRKVKHFQRFIPRILVDEPHYTDFSGCQTEV